MTKVEREEAEVEGVEHNPKVLFKGRMGLWLGL